MQSYGTRIDRVDSVYNLMGTYMLCSTDEHT